MLAGGTLAGLVSSPRAEVAASFRKPGGAPLATLVRMVLLCYYRDDRVMLFLALEPRPPFPKGHVVEQGDWSLLDPCASGRGCRLVDRSPMPREGKVRADGLA